MMDNEVFNEIEQLLKDISDYLEKKSQNEKLSAEEQEYAKKLIDRSKKQLEKIDEYKNSNNEYFEVNEVQKAEKDSYVPMYPLGAKRKEKKIVNDCLPQSPPPPLPAKSIGKRKTESPSPEPVCPYKELPAKQTSTGIKSGHLVTQRKILKILFNQKMFGVIHDFWLLIYISEKDWKPFYTIDLRYYKATVEEGDSNEQEGEESAKHFGKMTSSFKVLHTDLQGKKYEFVAKTEKDMRQWIAKINSTHEMALRAAQGIAEEIYEQWGTMSPQNNSEETSHLNPSHERSLQNKPLPLIPNQEDIKPDLPAKKQVPLLPTESLEDLYEELPFGDLGPFSEQNENVELMASSDSFDSVDDRDMIYDELADISGIINTNTAPPSTSLDKYSPELKHSMTPTNEEPEQYYDDITSLEEDVKKLFKPNQELKPSSTDAPIIKDKVINSLQGHVDVDKSKSFEKINKPAFKPSIVSKSPTTPIKPKIPTKPNTLLLTANKCPLPKFKSPGQKSYGNTPNKINPTPKKSTSNSSSTGCCFETFSKDSKTFQASTPKRSSNFESTMPVFDNSLKEINFLQSNNKHEENEQPMVLLKGEKNKNNLKKNLIKPAITSNKPKKPVVKKLAF
ncbi:uncharacterized protein LOC126748612 [Anthonomus grandis grandis]|uniref:uncharacterized protein LOC126748612 n=1 Tax=Anthonomus grandis grandis TaxID=2921223 RepID=UPI0021667CA1|nr:uncharacterized protein LOC126748612 [Anthonomus grandis grandis]